MTKLIAHILNAQNSFRALRGQEPDLIYVSTNDFSELSALKPTFTSGSHGVFGIMVNGIEVAANSFLQDGNPQAFSFNQYPLIISSRDAPVIKGEPKNVECECGSGNNFSGQNHSTWCRLYKREF